MDFAKHVARSLYLKRAGLGFLTEAHADGASPHDRSVSELKEGRGPTWAGGLEIWRTPERV